LLENFRKSSLAGAANVRQHPSVAAGRFVFAFAPEMPRRSLSALGALSVALLAVGCDAEVTPVGSWEPIVKQSLYLEAESGQLSGGFTVGSDVTASSAAYIAPPPGIFSDDGAGEAQSRYLFTLPAQTKYRIWGRIRSPNAINNRFWFQVDGGPWFKWRISTGDIWFWDTFHDDTDYNSPLEFDPSPDQHELVIANCAPGTELDRLYITAAGDQPPGNATPCRPPHSIEVGGKCFPSCGSQATATEDTTCLDTACQGRPTVQAYDCNLCCRIPRP
jgi:hypothetical protein